MTLSSSLALEKTPLPLFFKRNVSSQTVYTIVNDSNSSHMYFVTSSWKLPLHSLQFASDTSRPSVLPGAPQSAQTPLPGLSRSCFRRCRFFSCSELIILPPTVMPVVPNVRTTAATAALAAPAAAALSLFSLSRAESGTLKVDAHPSVEATV